MSGYTEVEVRDWLIFNMGMLQPDVSLFEGCSKIYPMEKEEIIKKCCSYITEHWERVTCKQGVTGVLCDLVVKKLCVEENQTDTENRVKNSIEWLLGNYWDICAQHASALDDVVHCVGSHKESQLPLYLGGTTNINKFLGDLEETDSLTKNDVVSALTIIQKITKNYLDNLAEIIFRI